ncbi:MAG: hypothetical protein ACOYUK_01890 [Patescibacteria group bacterium]
MHDDRWNEILAMVEEKFSVAERRTEALADVPRGTVEYIIFTGPVGRMKLERTSKPKVLGTRGMGSKRIGGDTSVSYQYSDTEFVKTFTAYRWDESVGQWTEIDAGAFGV